MVNWKKITTRFCTTAIISGMIVAANLFPAYAGGAVEGQTTVWSSYISADLDEPNYNSALTNFGIAIGSYDDVDDFGYDYDWEHIKEQTPRQYGLSYTGNGMDISKGKKKLTYGKDSDPDYFIWLYAYDNLNVSSLLSSICSSAYLYGSFSEEYWSSEGYVDLEEEFYGAYPDYSLCMTSMKKTKNDYAVAIYSYINRAMDVSNEIDELTFEVVDQSEVKIFPDSYEDLIYVSIKDYDKLCPWYKKYTWEHGKTTGSSGWLGTKEEATEYAQKYITTDYVLESAVAAKWKSLTGFSHNFLKDDIRPRNWKYMTEAKRKNWLKTNGGYYIKKAIYNSNQEGFLDDLLDSTRLPIGAFKERDYYRYGSKDNKKAYYYYTYIEKEEKMSSTWQISSDAKTWKTVVSNVEGSRRFYYNLMNDEISINNTYYSVSDILPNHGKTIYVRRLANCGNIFWKGTVTSPAFRIRPFLTLDGLDVYTNKKVVEGSYLDPKDIIVIAHYNTGDVVMSGSGSYIEYPGNSNLRVTIVGTNYAYYVYTDPQLGDVVRGYFQIQGIEKSPVSITAEYVGDPVVEKTEYDPSNLRVNVVFNNGSTDTFTADSSNIGTYKYKSYGKGDIDGNGVLNVSDKTKLREIIAGTTATADQKAQADFDGNGTIDTADITALENVISKVVTNIGSNTFFAAVSGLKMSDGSPVYARFTVEGVKKSPYSITVVNDPQKLTYIEGENFNPKDMVLKVLYDNGEYIYITYETSDLEEHDAITIGDLEHSPKSMTADTTSLPIYYTENGVTADTEITLKVSLTTLTSIKITRAPDEVIYYSGETFKSTGMDVTAYFDEGVEGHTPDEIILTSSEYIMNNYKKLQDGTENIVFLLDNPDQVKNRSGEYLLVAINNLRDNPDLTDQMHGTYTLKDGTAFDGTVCGNHLIKVSYTSRGITKTAYQPIYVYNKRPTSLTIVSMPYVTEYIAGQDFNTEGLILRAAYSDGSSAYLYPKTVSRNGYVMLDSTNLGSDRGYVIAQYTENVTTLQIEIPITVIDPNVDGITATYLGPAVYVGNQFNPKDVQIVISYTNGTIRSFRANEENADGTLKVKIVIPKDGIVDPDASANYTLLNSGANTFAACYAGFYDLFDVNGVDNPDQLDFTNSIAKSKRMYDTWTEDFTAMKIRTVADYINGRVELLDRESLDEYHSVTPQTTTDTRTALTAEEGTGKGINLETSEKVSPLLSFLREGTWRQPETVISVSYKARTKGFLYPETTNSIFTQKNEKDLRYIQEHEQFYDTPRDTLQSYTDEGWSDWVNNGDSVGTVMADRVAYNYVGAGGNSTDETMVLERVKIKLENIPEGSSPELNVFVRDSKGVETIYHNIQESDLILDPCQIKMELSGTVNVIDNYGQTVTRPFGDVYKIFYRTTIDDATGWSSEGEWAGYSDTNMQCLEIKLMLEETDFNTGTVTNAPTINRQPKNLTVKIGANATFSVSAVGNDLYYQWYCNGTAIPRANDPVYATPEATLADDGNIYYCMIIADNGTGLSTKSSSVSLTVRDTSPVLTKDIQEQCNGKVGDKAEFEVDAFCLDLPSLQYEWQITKNGRYVSLPNGDSKTLTLDITADMHGEYIRCHITNTQGSCNSNPCLITCIGAPIVTIESSAESQYVASSGASMITFHAAVTSDATGAMEYEWTFDGVTKNSATGDSTTWLPTKTGTHTITCTVTDSIGNTGTGTYIVYVGVKPTVTLSTSQRTEADGSITIIVNADVSSYDSENITYTWTYDGVSISGDQSITESADHKTLTITNATTGNHSITLTIKDGFGTASALQAAVAK